MMNYKYKFTIIMSIYNKEKDLKDAIDSVVSQDIDFKKNVQLILVNDGSTDNSEITCLKYKEMYKDNIVYVSKKNGGIASAKNEGLKYRKGKYVNFFEADDILDKSVLKRVYRFFEKHTNKIDMVTIPVKNFGEVGDTLPNYKKMPLKDTIISLDKTPEIFVISSSSSFYKTELFNKHKFDDKKIGIDDLKFINELYNNNYLFGYVCGKNVVYNHNKIAEKESLSDKIYAKKEYYLNLLNYLEEMVQRGNEKEYQKEIVMYHLVNSLKNLYNFVKSKEEYDVLLDKYKKLLMKIDDKFVINDSNYCEKKADKIMILKIKYDKLDKVREMLLKNMVEKVNLKFEEIKNRRFLIDIVYDTLSLDNISLVMKNKEGNIVNPVIKKQLNSSYDLKFENQLLQETLYARYEIDMKNNGKYSFYFVDNNTKKQYLVKKINKNNRKRFSLNSKKTKLFSDGYSVSVVGEKIVVKKDSTPNFIYLLYTTIIMFIKNGYLPIYRLFSKRNKKYILIYDRPEKAGDNGEALFQHICKSEKEMAKNTYFVISKKSHDYDRMKEIGNVVNIRSLKHKILFLNARMIFSSHTLLLFIDAFKYGKYKYYADLLDFKLVWLQHGITQNDISKSANRFKNTVDLFVTATNDEYNEISSEKYFYFDNQVILTGFSRYDKLYNDPHNIISVVPTWRRNLSGGALENGFHKTSMGFEHSDYYINYANVLENKKLIKLLEDNNYILQFVLHPGMTAYKEMFEKFQNERIKIISPKDVNYTELFATSKLLITDYSSVFFDFAYLKKPEIYFQFDRDEFYKDHYSPGYFKIENDGFGDIVINDKDLVNKIEYYFNNNFNIEDKYLNKINNTFKYLDKNNSKRIIDCANRIL